MTVTYQHHLLSLSMSSVQKPRLSMNSSCCRWIKMFVAETRRDALENSDRMLMAKSTSSSTFTLCCTVMHHSMNVTHGTR